MRLFDSLSYTSVDSSHNNNPIHAYPALLRSLLRSASSRRVPVVFRSTRLLVLVERFLKIVLELVYVLLLRVLACVLAALRVDTLTPHRPVRLTTHGDMRMQQHKRATSSKDRPISVSLASVLLPCEQGFYLDT